jgi:hypothetical protein
MGLDAPEPFIYTSCRLIFCLAVLKMLWVFTGAFADAIRTTWNTNRYACAFQMGIAKPIIQKASGIRYPQTFYILAGQKIPVWYGLQSRTYPSISLGNPRIRLNQWFPHILSYHVVPGLI